MLPTENQVNQLTAEVAYSVIGALTDSLRITAQTAGWPEDIVDALSVEFDGNAIYIDYPDKLSEVIDDLEYGKPYGLPNPVIYPFIMRAAPYISETLANTAFDEIFDMEEVF